MIWLSRRRMAAILAVLSVLLLSFIMLTDQLAERGERSGFSVGRLTQILHSQAQPENLRLISGGRGSNLHLPAQRIVHLDLKGAPPKLTYLKEIIPMMSQAGATGLLVEYEDMFPYWGPLANISAHNAYSKQDIMLLTSLAESNNLTLIPLVQTFGHLEFVLKLQQYEGLRESPTYPQSLCPSRERSWQLVSTMIDQVAELHPKSTHIHVGCDEVYQVGECGECLQRLTEANAKGQTYHDSRWLFLEHVRRVAEKVVSLARIPIIWDDMLRNINKADIIEARLGELVEPMVWAYVEDIDRFVDSLTWRIYSEIFSKGIWTASAFKGASGERTYSSNLNTHLLNQISWLDVITRESTNTNYPIHFKGIALTGWSRYDHFASLCELLPVALPSLILSLTTLAAGGLNIPTLRKVNEILQCSPTKSLMTSQELKRNPFQWDLYRCSYPGSKAFSLISSYHTTKRDVDELYSRLKERDGWMSDWHLHHKYSSPWRIEASLKSYTYLPGLLRDLKQQARRTLGIYIDRFSVEEWLEQNLEPLVRKTEELFTMQDVLGQQKHWPRRPL